MILSNIKFVKNNLSKMQNYDSLTNAIRNLATANVCPLKCPLSEFLMNFLRLFLLFTPYLDIISLSNKLSKKIKKGMIQYEIFY